VRAGGLGKNPSNQGAGVGGVDDDDDDDDSE
jgi:hypothetical protein